MLKKIIESLNQDKDYPDRAHKIDVYTRVLNGELYDKIPNSFSDEYDSSGKYIPLYKRRPSIKTPLCKSVVDSSVSLLFGEDHFPEIIADANDDEKYKLNKIFDGIKLRETMISAALNGSVGSVVLFIRFVNGEPQIEVKGTQYLTAYFNPANPTELTSLVEQYKIAGKDLIKMGYQVADKNTVYWFLREWDDKEERIYHPFQNGEEPKVDEEKTIKHDLGKVPAIWIKNLPKVSSRGFNETDGDCTFASAIDFIIEMDYLLSQGGRGLKYSADPLVVFRVDDELSLANNAIAVSGDVNQTKKIVRSGSNAFVIGKDDDVNLLEISGKAAEAIIAHVRYLRELAMEGIHGNRSHADKISVAHSGAAMSKLDQALLWLVDVLRISYGDNGIVPLIKLLIHASHRIQIMIDGESISPIKECKIKLNWPEWDAPSVDEKKKIADTVKSLSDAQIISKKTATTFIADDYNITSVDDEQKEIEIDQQKLMEQQPQIKETIAA